MRVLVDDLHQGPELAPAAPVLEPGRNRFPVCAVRPGQPPDRRAEVRLYVSRGLDETARGPYVAQLPLDRGEAPVPQPEHRRGPGLGAVDLRRRDAVPERRQLRGGRRRQVERQAGRRPHTGDGRATATCRAPGTARSACTPRRSHRSGATSSKIETRVPPDTMHDVDLADALDRHRPIVLLFATPALCQSRICGPVTDVTEQVKSEFDDDADFIHMEIYNDNDLNKGPRPQFRAWHLNEGAGAVHDRARTGASSTESRERSRPTSCARRCAGRSAERLRAGSRRGGRGGAGARARARPRERSGAAHRRSFSAADVARVAKRVERMRGLRFERPVRPLFLDRDEALELVQRISRSDYPERRRRVDDEGLKLLGLLRPVDRSRRGGRLGRRGAVARVLRRPLRAPGRDPRTGRDAAAARGHARARAGARARGPAVRAATATKGCPTTPRSPRRRSPRARPRR